MHLYFKMSTGLALTLLIVLSGKGGAQENFSRYFYHGDGKLAVAGGTQKLKPLSGRLTALLDYLQDQLTDGKGTIEIISGYRSPEYNEALRKKGRLAAKASLHIEGMAADFALSGVPAKKLWEFVRELDCCGAGYYAGQMVHVDTGPARFWDQKGSKVFTDISAHNKQIYLTTEFDIYRLGETLNFRFVRMTEYPFGVLPKMEIVQKGRSIKKMKLKSEQSCLLIQNREEAQYFSITLPQRLLREAPLQLRLRFCQKPSPEMPDFVLSNPLVIR